jgi:hypothetical protein
MQKFCDTRIKITKDWSTRKNSAGAASRTLFSLLCPMQLKSMDVKDVSDFGEEEFLTYFRVTMRTYRECDRMVTDRKDVCAKFWLLFDAIILPISVRGVRVSANHSLC